MLFYPIMHVKSDKKNPDVETPELIKHNPKNKSDQR
jgi:hypothetical protein